MKWTQTSPWRRPWRVAGFLAVVGLAVGAGPAPALPPPLSPADLEKQSDVIATVRVLAVTCTGQAPFGQTNERVPTYQAWLQIVEVKKGSVKPHETVVVQWQDIPKTLIGPWKVEYWPGEEARTHLRWDADRHVYATTWWNAKGKPTRPAEVAELPGKPGQVITATSLAATK
jgi:hypothetical protein